jgi:hypothetical protein
MEEKLSATNFELSTVTAAKGFVVHSQAELQPIIDRALAEAAAEVA